MLLEWLKETDKSLSPLIITAHFDHLGTRWLGNKYGGALDNASGTSFILNYKEAFPPYAKPERDIIFVALNAEEFGLLRLKTICWKNIF